MFLYSVALILAIATYGLSLAELNSTVNDCGQTLLVTQFARIEYKLDDNYNSFELCPWIIRIYGAGSLRFDLESQESVDQVAKVSVATISMSKQGPDLTLLRSQDMNLSNGPSVATLSGGIAIVIFSSGEYQGRGFALNITRVTLSDDILSPDSVYEIQNGNFGTFTHPAEGGYYENNELSAFVVAPAGYQGGCSGFQCINMEYTEITVESYCYDRVDFFAFIASVDGGWTHVRMICGGEETALLPYLGEMALVTFASDLTQVMAGFSIRYETTPVVNSDKNKAKS